jgi:hypothetical protein
MKPIASTVSSAARLIAAAALALCLAACAPTRVETEYAAAPPAMERPQTIVVQDFTIPAGGAALDRGLRARLERTFEGGRSTASEGMADAAKTADALAQSIVKALDAQGLPATRSTYATQSPTGTTLIVSGQLLSVDEGNGTRRNVIGFGAGHSDVSAKVQLYLVRNGGAPQLIESFTADAQSSRKPGMAATGGAGAAAGHIAQSTAVGVGSSALMDSSTEGDAERMGKEIASKISALLPATR